ncbi:MAG: hypothetical protein ACXVZV_13185 [Terriglobales bacterium]
MKHLLAILTLLIAMVATATTVKPMTVEELTSSATTIVEGQVTDSWSTWNAQHTLIYTFTHVRVAKTLKGKSEETITVKQLGGSAGGYTQKVAGVHPMRTSDNAVLFLRPSEARDGTMVVVGLMQGNFRVERDARSGTVVVDNGVADVHQSTPTGVSDYRGAKLTLRQLEARVRQAANE